MVATQCVAENDIRILKSELLRQDALLLPVGKKEPHVARKLIGIEQNSLTVGLKNSFQLQILQYNIRIKSYKRLKFIPETPFC